VEGRNRAPQTLRTTPLLRCVAESAERRQVQPSDTTSIQQAEIILREEGARRCAALFGVMISREVVHGTARYKTSPRTHEAKGRSENRSVSLFDTLEENDLARYRDLGTSSAQISRCFSEGDVTLCCVGSIR
jgi:hypothetical protein